jgi:hypothetical protein
VLAQRGRSGRCSDVLGAELLVVLPLMRAKPPRDVRNYGCVQAALAVPAEARQALAFDPQHVAGLSSGQRRDDRGWQRRLGGRLMANGDEGVIMALVA